MKIFSSDKVRDIDKYTIKNEPIESIYLMERAATALYKWYIKKFERSHNILVFTGPGNNGGDGLALSRMLAGSGYKVKVFHLAFSSKTSKNWSINRDRLIDQNKAEYNELRDIEDLPYISPDNIVIDAIFGSGLDRTVEGITAQVIGKINDSGAKIISVDIPSGLFGEDNTGNNMDNIVKADYTLTLQFPKVSFFFADHHSYVGRFYVLPIGLHPAKINSTSTDYNIIDNNLVAGILKNRAKYDHKGNFGHGLMIAGSCGKAGAAVLASHAALRTGIGLLTAHVPRPVAEILHTSLPEAMVECDQSDIMVTEIPDPGNYDALAIGPGLGTKPNTKKGLKDLLGKYNGPLVIDADALNIIASEKELAGMIKENIILTPHPGEFRRLTGSDAKAFARLKKQQDLSVKHKCVTILKGAHTSVCLPDGRVWFNLTGNPGMATAGSGDVLTGMILSLLAQGYKPSEAAIAAVYIHGLAGDLAAEKTGYESLIASDIIYNIGNSFKKIRQFKNK